MCNSNRSKRRALSKARAKSISSTIEEIISNENSKVPHCLWHLTTREWNRMKDYSIHLTELFAGHITVYNNVTLGSKAKAPLKTKTAHGNTIR